MSKKLFIAEKPSVAAEFAKVLKVNGGRKNGYIESDKFIVTWCVGLLVTMSYPEVYDPGLKWWRFDTLPFLPEQYRYEVISGVRQQFDIVSGLLNRDDVDTIYVCTDSGREGEYIYRLVDQMAAVPDTKKKLRVWIDSQTEEEIIRGIKNALPESEYDNLACAASLRGIEDYLMGINFSRGMTIRYGPALASALNTKKVVISTGRVMTCVLGMVVRREMDIRSFVKKSFYGIEADCRYDDAAFSAEWKAVEGSRYFASPKLYKDNGFNERSDAEDLMNSLSKTAEVISAVKKTETKNPPLLFNLAELQNECSKRFKISPDNTLKIAQELYEKKLTTYPRTDARVLSTAVAKEIGKNIGGLKGFAPLSEYAAHILDAKLYVNLAKTRYVNDKAITDHYAIIPTGQGLGALNGLSQLSRSVYELICRRFLSIFYPAAKYQKLALTLKTPENECFFANFRILKEPGYLVIADPRVNRQADGGSTANVSARGDISREMGQDQNAGKQGDRDEQDIKSADMEKLSSIKKGSKISIAEYRIKERETSPPKRYSSGSMILAMENAGELIEDEELRSQIKGSGIGTSATRAEILNKLIKIGYLKLNAKTQIISPAMLGEMIYIVTEISLKQLLNPELTASWEKGLTMVSEGTVSREEYMDKLNGFVRRRTDNLKRIAVPAGLDRRLAEVKKYY